LAGWPFDTRNSGCRFSAREIKGLPSKESHCVQFVTEAVEEKLRVSKDRAHKPWMKHVGKLKHLRKETHRIEKLIENEFERVEPEIWGL
jgi:hypothetical protein